MREEDVVARGWREEKTAKEIAEEKARQARWDAAAIARAQAKRDRKNAKRARDNAT